MSEDDADSAGGEADEQRSVVSAVQSLTPDVIRQNFALKFGLVLLVMALSIGVIGFAATTLVTAETEANVESQFESDANQEADIVEQWIESNSLQTEIQANKGEYGEDRDAVNAELRDDLARAGDDVHSLHILEDDDIEGLRVFASADDAIDPDTPLAEFDDREWMFEAAGGDIRLEIINLQTDPNDPEASEVFVSDTYEADGEQVVAFIAQTAADPDRFLLTEVTVDAVQETLRGAQEDDTGFTQVVKTGAYLGDGDDNQVMMDARGDAGSLLSVYAENDATLAPLQSDQQSGVFSNMDADPDVLDEDYAVGYSSVDGTDWVVLSHGPRSDVFGFVDTLSTWGLIATAFAVLLIGVTGAGLGYSTSTAIDRLTRKTEEIREGNLEVDLTSSRVDNIGRLYEGFAAMRDALITQIERSEEARKEAEQARTEAEAMTEYLQEKAEEYSEIMQHVSSGDLTQRMEQDGTEESMDQIAAEFNGMIEELEKTTGQLKSYVDEVEEAGSEVETSAGTVKQASEQVADSIQKISDDAYTQKERLETISSTMDEVADQLDVFADEHDIDDFDDTLGQIDEVATDINEVANLSEETMAESQHVAGAAEEQAAELNEVSERANDLQRYAAPLRDILGRFETEAEHEFVFSVGPTGGVASPSSRSDGGSDEESE